QGSSASGELPVAEEVPGSSSGLFDSGKLAHTPGPGPQHPREDDSPSYGRTPDQDPDASSILADLTEPANKRRGRPSSTRVEAPGVERTLSSNPRASTEFDLSVNEGNVPPELADADAAAREGGDRKSTSESDVFLNPQSAAELNKRGRKT